MAEAAFALLNRHTGGFAYDLHLTTSATSQRKLFFPFAHCVCQSENETLSCRSYARRKSLDPASLLIDRERKENEFSDSDFSRQRQLHRMLCCVVVCWFQSKRVLCSCRASKSSFGKIQSPTPRVLLSRVRPSHNGHSSGQAAFTDSVRLALVTYRLLVAATKMPYTLQSRKQRLTTSKKCLCKQKELKKMH